LHILGKSIYTDVVVTFGNETHAVLSNVQCCYVMKVLVTYELKTHATLSMINIHLVSYKLFKQLYLLEKESFKDFEQMILRKSGFLYC